MHRALEAPAGADRATRPMMVARSAIADKVDAGQLITAAHYVPPIWAAAGGWMSLQ